MEIILVWYLRPENRYGDCGDRGGRGVKCWMWDTRIQERDLSPLGAQPMLASPICLHVCVSVPSIYKTRKGE